MQETNDLIFGMTLDEISQAADALSKQSDGDIPIESCGSYKDFIETMKRGHEKLMNCKSYNANHSS
jgi:hypothetical protein